MGIEPYEPEPKPRYNKPRSRTGAPDHFKLWMVNHTSRQIRWSRGQTAKRFLDEAYSLDSDGPEELS